VHEVTDGVATDLGERLLRVPAGHVRLGEPLTPAIFRYIERRRRIVPVTAKVPGYGELVKKETRQLSQHLA